MLQALAHLHVLRPVLLVQQPLAPVQQLPARLHSYSPRPS